MLLSQSEDSLNPQNLSNTDGNVAHFQPTYRPKGKDKNDDGPEPKTFKEIVKKWPKITFCIIGNEFCERYSIYALKAVLTLYGISILGYSDDDATSLFHGFEVVCYLTPLLGSTLADGYIGKFWTILWLSLLYALGNIILTVASRFPKRSKKHPYLDFFGLLIIGIGTGGIKPCVSAFGGDQFNPRHIKMIAIFFSVFYFTINAGSAFATILTPHLRTVPCMGNNTCFPLAFGVPAVLMIISTIFFVAGSTHYKKFPAKENIILRVIRTVFTAIKNKIKSKVKRDHWVEHFLDNHDCSKDKRCQILQLQKEDLSYCDQKNMVEDIKSLIRVMILLSPVPMFWALFDQQGSRWLIQAVAMDGRITNSITLLPDLINTLNTIFVMLFIPIFQIIIYPLFEKMGIKTTPLRRMVAGAALAAVSFSVCGTVQLNVNRSQPDILPSDRASVSFINTLNNCNITVETPGELRKIIAANSSLVDNKVSGKLELFRIIVGKSKTNVFNITFEGKCNKENVTYEAELLGGKSFYIIVSDQGIFKGEAKMVKSKVGKGYSTININFLWPCSEVPQSVNWGNCKNRSKANAYFGGLSLRPLAKTSGYTYDWSVSDAKRQKLISPNKSSFTATVYDFHDIGPGEYQAYYKNDKGEDGKEVIPVDGFVFKIEGMGAVYSLTSKVRNEGPQPVPQLNMHTIIPANSVNILWQIPQYVIITAGEVLFSITGLELAYSQSAPSLKSVVQAIWLYTVAAGGIIVIIVSKSSIFDNLAYEMFAYSGAMFLVTIVFALLAIFYYKYSDYTERSLEANKAK